MSIHKVLAQSAKEARVRAAIAAAQATIAFTPEQKPDASQTPAASNLKEYSLQLLVYGYCDRLASDLRKARRSYCQEYGRYFRPSSLDLIELANEAESRLLQDDIDLTKINGVLDEIKQIRRGESWMGRSKPLFLLPGSLLAIAGGVGAVVCEGQILEELLAMTFTVGVVFCIVFGGILLSD